MASDYPVEPKVKVGATVVAAVGLLVAVASAITESGVRLPGWVAAAVATILAAGSSFLAAYRAPHQDRREPKNPPRPGALPDTAEPLADEP